MIRVLDIFMLFTSSKKTRKMGSELRVSEHMMFNAKLQARELPVWTIPQKFHAANYRRFTVLAVVFKLASSMAPRQFVTYMYMFTIETAKF